MTKNRIEEAKKKFQHLVEYTMCNSNVTEDETDPNAMGADQGMGGGPGMGGDPNAMGADPGMGGDPNAMGMDPGMGGDPNAMGGGQQPPQGFQPQGVDQNGGMDGMGGDMSQGEGQVGPNDDVIEIDDLTDAQEDTEKKVDRLSSKFEKLMSSLDGIEKRINDIDAS